MGRERVVGQDFAETVALKGLAWLAGEENLLPVFLGASGTSAEELRNRASEPDFLGSVLDFILMDDAWVVTFCDTAGIDYSIPLQARQALPGGAVVHWT